MHRGRTDAGMAEILSRAKICFDQRAFTQALALIESIGPGGDGYLDSEVQALLGLTQLELKAYEAGEIALARALTGNPSSGLLRHRRAGALYQLDRYAEAERELVIAQALSPDLPGIAHHLRKVREKIAPDPGSRPEERRRSPSSVADIFANPDWALDYLLPEDKLGWPKGLRRALVAALRSSIAACSGLDGLYGAIGNEAWRLSHADIAVRAFQRACDAAPTIERKFHFAGQYFTMLMMAETTTSKSLFQAQKAMVGYLLPELEVSREFPNDPDPERRLRIGFTFVSAGSREFSRLFGRLLLAHDLQAFEAHIFTRGPRSQFFENTPVIWHDCQTLAYREVAAEIRSAGIDVLYDLNGWLDWMFGLAEKPAPIQISGFNWSGTTGLAAFDYVVGAAGTPDEAEMACFTERAYRLPRSRGAVRFAEDFPYTAVPPHRRNGFVTFGCFGQSHKVNEYNIVIWSKVLHRCDGAILYLRNNALNDAAGVDIYLEWFRRQGIGANRLRLEPSIRYADFLQCYADVDIALDTFPHAGGNTTFESLRAGVPVVTLRGQRWNTHSSWHILEALGAPELSGHSEEEFVDVAARLACSPERLDVYRRELPDRLLKSPYTDVQGCSGDLQTMYRTLWRQWCAEQRSKAGPAG